MIIRMKWIAWTEFLIIAVLLAAFFAVRSHTEPIKPTENVNGLLSPRIYAGVLEPKSYLITNFDPLRESFQKYIKGHNLDVELYAYKVHPIWDRTYHETRLHIW